MVWRIPEFRSGSPCYACSLSPHSHRRSHIVVIYATGEGQTAPGGIDGQLANGPSYPKPVQPVTVNIGGIPAEVLYAGAAPNLVAGVMQINVRIPADAPSGNLPVDVVAGQTHSQPGVTIAVK